MKSLSGSRRRASHRGLLMMADPARWPCWPFLPVVRTTATGTMPECGVLYDAGGASGTFGFSSTVFAANLFLLPNLEADLLAGPRYVYDTREELADDGWVVN